MSSSGALHYAIGFLNALIEVWYEWAVSVGVISGKGNGVLDPKGTATRAEVAQIVMNYGVKI